MPPMDLLFAAFIERWMPDSDADAKLFLIQLGDLLVGFSDDVIKRGVARGVIVKKEETKSEVVH